MNPRSQGLGRWETLEEVTKVVSFLHGHVLHWVHLWGTWKKLKQSVHIRLVFLLLTLLQMSSISPPLPTSTHSPPPPPLTFTTLLPVSMGYAYMFFG